MSTEVASTAQQVTAGATIGGGGLSFIAMHSSEITVIAVVITAAASIIFGIWNGRIQSERNSINKKNITDAIINDPNESLSVDELKKLNDNLNK